MNITPDQADQWAQGATEGPWCYMPGKWGRGGSLFLGDGFALATSDGGMGDVEWNNPEGNLPLIAAAPDLAQTIAGMEWQYAVEVYSDDAKCWIQGTNWIGNKELAAQHLGEYDGDTTRLVRRLVGPVEVTE
ncbi:hypothetical protein [Corynebacterium nuruki]|uniref:hypothetical protein n=1 Tax=Corynebacterium nuruki TaxID=1032851 RepID=UPI0039BFE06A